jgi:2-oxoglutarate ferredoxin oxidoreductase subunit alpha
MVTSDLPVINKPIQEIESATVRFVGDSGDGMQLVGTQFTTSSVLWGNDVSTLPDFPAEIRAPAGTIAGVSGYQINFSSNEIYTPGDQVDTLFAMNPAALKANLRDLQSGGLCIVNEEAFTKDGLDKAGYDENPLENGSLDDYRLVTVPITKLTLDAVEGLGLNKKEAGRCKNFFTLGLAYWLYHRPIEKTIEWLEKKFAKNEAIKDANIRALKAGNSYGENVELIASTYMVNKAQIAPGKYRKLTGNAAIAMGLVAASKLSNKPLFYGSYPITPASDILHDLSAYKGFGVTTFQAEDEIAAVCSALGAAYGGALAVTGTSGPGVALKQEAIGLAVMTELPMVIVNVQRGGPSTGLPTKTEQADLLQAIYGRNGECPMPVLAASTPSDCFETAIEACHIAMRLMTPVMLLSDGYIGNGAEPWKIPNVEDLPKIDIPYYTNGKVSDQNTNGNGFKPYLRNEELSRPWAIPGTPGYEHRIGGLEKQNITGNVSYDPANHDEMIRLRQKKVKGLANLLPPVKVNGEESGEVLVIGWGSTYGAIRTAVDRARKQGKSVSSVHIRHMYPLPKNLGSIIKSFKHVLVPEINLGQFRMMLRSNYLVDASGLNLVRGLPFQVREITAKIDELLEK